ncbi:MAG: tRNA (N6-threonylcarbamoyladenosine(37)-N6)-methyltransferase TrmO [Haloplanus sp.]
MDEICYRPVGEVRSPFETPADVPRNVEDSTEARGTIELDPAYEAGLAELDGFSHVTVVAHLHRSEGFDLRIHPPWTDARPGVFATRSPRRPNPIATSVCRLTGVEGSTVRVRDVDLVDGTPVLDLKPFAPKPHEIDGVEMGWLADAGDDGDDGDDDCVSAEE